MQVLIPNISDDRTTASQRPPQSQPLHQSEKLKGDTQKKSILPRYGTVYVLLKLATNIHD